MAIPRVRRLTLQDLDTVIRIQGNCYSTALIESRKALGEHIASGHPCWLAEVDAAPAGYLLAANLTAQDTPSPISLGTTDRPPPSDSANWLYLHDLAVLPDCRGSGASRALLDAANQHLKENQKLQAIALVAVQDSVPFWQRQGFEIKPSLSEELSHKLATYGPHARYMWRPR